MGRIWPFRSERTADSSTLSEDARACAVFVSHARLGATREVRSLRADEHVPDGGVDVVCVRLDDRRLGFALQDVREVLPAAEATALPHAPEVVLGLVNLRGEPLPVLDLRARLGLPVRSLHPGDHVLVCSVGTRGVGVWVDHADDILHVDAADVVPLDDAAPHLYVNGAVMLDDGLMLITDVDTFLDARESAQLESAVAATTHGTDR